MFETDDVTLLFNALTFAAYKHRDQRRKDREATPYINHPIQVMEILWGIGQVRDMVLLAGALLHDTLEDTDATEEEIIQQCGEEVLALVLEVTDDKHLSKVQRKQHQINHAPHLSFRAKQLKLADKICNVHDISLSPPLHWSFKRRRDYLLWSEEVVSGLRGVNVYLEAHFDETLATSHHDLKEQEDTEIIFHKDDRVRHAKRPEWGMGQIVNCMHQRVQAFFVNKGLRSIKLDNAPLVKLSEKTAVHPVLDNLKMPKIGQRMRYISLAEQVEIFLGFFHEGFYTPRYIEQRRNPLLNAHKTAQELLGREAMGQLLADQNYQKICQHALTLITHTPITLKRNSVAAFEQALQTESAQKAFAQSLYDLLFSEDKHTLEQRFNSFVQCLQALGIAHWCISTYFLFIIYPQNHIVVSHATLLPAAELCAFELNYSTQPNWNTYQHALRFANYLKQALNDMKPHDMFDVYNFMAAVLLAAE